MTNKDKEIMVEEELDDFFSESEESSGFKLLLEFIGSKYKYKGIEFEIEKNTQKNIIKARKIDLTKRKRKGNKLF